MIAAFPLATAKQVTELRWLEALPGWATFLIVLGFVSWAVWIYRQERSSRGVWARGFLAALRVAALLAVLLMLYRPVQTTTQEQVRPSYVALLIDTSVSMSLSDHVGDPSERKRLAQLTGLEPEALESHSRLDLVKRALVHQDAALLRRLLEQNRVRLYRFDSRTRPLGELGEGTLADQTDAPKTQRAEKDEAAVLERLRMLEPDGAETALGDAIARALADLRGKNVAGLIVLTDGRSNAGARSPQALVNRLRRRGIPLYTVGVGNPEAPLDLALASLDAASVVRAGDVLQIGVVLRASGLGPEIDRVPIEVRLDDKLVRTETIEFDADEVQGGEVEKQLALRIRPEQVGEYTLVVSVPPQPGELIADNNRLQQRLRVIDKRIRVLYVENLPRYEYRFLRWGLVRDRNMEAQIFQTSADPDYVQDASPGITPLDHVPSTREELFSYHVVILGDVDPFDPQLGEQRLSLLKEFVQDYGGGLVVISGRMFMPRAYAGTPLEPLLPVRVDRADDDLGTLGTVIRSSFHPKLTVDGRRHALMRLEDDAEANRRLWEEARLPGFYWYYKARAVKPGAEVLAVHPEARTQKGDPVPIFALMPAGAGMTFYSATDDVWRWRAGVGDRYTYRFWGQVIRHLAAGRLSTSKRFSITTDRTVYDLGDRILVQAEVRDRDLKPSEQEKVRAFMQREGGEAKPIVLEREVGAPGRYQAELIASEVGDFRVWLGPEGAVEPNASDDALALRVFSVQVPELEKADPRMDEALLTSMAEQTEGHYVRLSGLDTLPERIGAVREVVEVRLAQNERWDEPWVLLAVVALLGLEWALRRRWEML